MKDKIAGINAAIPPNVPIVVQGGFAAESGGRGQGTAVGVPKEAIGIMHVSVCMHILKHLFKICTLAQYIRT